MRGGRKPRNRQVVDAGEDAMGMPVADQRDFAAPPATPAGDTSETQLSFDSLNSLDEPAEVLVRISNESLAGLPDLPAEDEPADGFAGQPDDFPEADMTAEAGEGTEVEDTEAAEGSAAYEDAEVQIENSEAVAGSEPEAPAEDLDEGQAESGADLRTRPRLRRSRSSRRRSPCRTSRLLRRRATIRRSRSGWRAFT